MVRLPWLSSMHLRKLLTSVAQAPPCCADVLTVCCEANSVLWGDASAGALEPPENQPPTAWPIDEPTATPLGAVSMRIEVVAEKRATHAAVEAIWPNRPGPCGVAAAAGAAAAGGAAAWGGCAAVEAWRAGAGAGFAGAVGRRGGAAPPRWRGMFADGSGLVGGGGVG